MTHNLHLTFFTKSIARLFCAAAIFFVAAHFFISCASSSNSISQATLENQQASSFSEIWGYVMEKREDEFRYDIPLTDIGYFAGEVDCYGHLPKVPSRKQFSSFTGRVHFVTSCDSRGLTHFIISRDSPARSQLIKALIQASTEYDGIQIDYELVPLKDGDDFISFLKELKTGLKEKTLSVAVPARTRTIKNDVYSYSEISSVADKVIVMAYDEHWSTSTPGAIASIDWCNKIADYASSVIPPEKLVMGIPFYGRTWGDDKNVNKAWYHEGISRIMQENKIKKINRDKDGVPNFSYKAKQTVTVWYEDKNSLRTHCEQYSQKNIKSVAFWRIGQEDPDFWNYIAISSQSF